MKKFLLIFISVSFLSCLDNLENLNSSGPDTNINEQHATTNEPLPSPSSSIETNYPYIISLEGNGSETDIFKNSIIVSGGNFDSNSLVLLNGTSLETEFISDSKLKAIVPQNQKEGLFKLSVTTDVGEAEIDTHILRGEKGIQGEKGDKGDKGDKGEKGEKGDPGDRGDKGDTGSQGENGLAGYFVVTADGENIGKLISSNGYTYTFLNELSYIAHINVITGYLTYYSSVYYESDNCTGNYYTLGSNDDYTLDYPINSKLIYRSPIDNAKMMHAANDNITQETLCSSRSITNDCSTLSSCKTYYVQPLEEITEEECGIKVKYDPPIELVESYE